MKFVHFIPAGTIKSILLFCIAICIFGINTLERKGFIILGDSFKPCPKVLMIIAATFDVPVKNNLAVVEKQLVLIILVLHLTFENMHIY